MRVISEQARVGDAVRHHWSVVQHLFDGAQRVAIERGLNSVINMLISIVSTSLKNNTLKLLLCYSIG